MLPNDMRNTASTSVTAKASQTFANETGIRSRVQQRDTIDSSTKIKKAAAMFFALSTVLIEIGIVK